MSEHNSIREGNPTDVCKNVQNAHKNRKRDHNNKIVAYKNKDKLGDDKIKSSKERRISTVKEMRVINDPYRRDIIFALRNLNKPATSKEVANLLGETPSKINYHMGILHEYGFVTLDHTKNINGIIAKYYKPEVSSVSIDTDSNDSELKNPKVLKEFIRMQFDMARDDFLGKVLEKTNEELEKDNEMSPTMSTNKLYLSKEQKKEYEELLKKVLNYKGSDEDSVKAYSVFISYIESDK